VPENDVGLDAQLLQVENSLLKVMPECRVGLVEVEFAIRAFFEDSSNVI
jgi:hypothetical protein